MSEAEWIKTPGIVSSEFTLPIAMPPSSETLFLQIDNEDNAPIALENFQAFYPASRILFKTTDDGALDLYYGNQKVNFPNYDLSLVAGQLLVADKTAAGLGAEQSVKPTRVLHGILAGKTGLVFWGVLALVVIGLLVVISRLLPKSVST